MKEDNKSKIIQKNENQQGHKFVKPDDLPKSQNRDFRTTVKIKPPKK